MTLARNTESCQGQALICQKTVIEVSRVLYKAQEKQDSWAKRKALDAPELTSSSHEQAIYVSAGKLHSCR